MTKNYVCMKMTFFESGTICTDGFESRDEKLDYFEKITTFSEKK